MKRFLLFLGLCAIARAETIVTVQGPSQWDAQISTTCTWTFNTTARTVSWNVSHVSTYTQSGGFQIFRTRATVELILAHYTGNPPTPFGQSQSGTSAEVHEGDTFTCTAGALTYVVAFPKKWTIALKNESDVPIKYKIIAQAADDSFHQVGSTLTMQPHTALIQVIAAPAGYHDALVYYELNDVEWTDGQGWAVAPGATVTGQATNGGNTPATSQLNSWDDTIPEIVNPIDFPAGVPSGPAPSISSGGAIWSANTATVDVLTKPVYREGVDKLIATINKAAAEQKGRDDIAANSRAAVKIATEALTEAVTGGPDQTPLEIEAVEDPEMAAQEAASSAALLAKMPGVPSMPANIGSSATYTVQLFDGPWGTKSVTFNLAGNATAWGALRAMELALLGILFFFATVNLLRRAVAS